ncbi:hypothetical protein BJX63DRAFT_416603, partial [Aspergillus granulosus]
IYLLNPMYITRLSDLLLQGAVMKRPIQPYESHLQYIPQWMCDYSLYGCAFMKCSKVKFRSPIPEYLDLPDLTSRWHDRSIPLDWVSDESDLPKQSHCSLEADVCVQDILNRLEISERSIHQDFGELLKPMTPNEKLVPSLAGLWEDERRRRKKRLGLVDPESSPFSDEDLVSLSANPRKSSQGEWIHGDEFQNLVRQIAAEERRHDSDRDITLDGLIQDNPLEKGVKSALESVEDFYPGPNGFANLQLSYHAGTDHVEEGTEDLVDENAVQPNDSDRDFYSSDDGSMSDMFSEEEDEMIMVDDVPKGGNPNAGDQSQKTVTPPMNSPPPEQSDLHGSDTLVGVVDSGAWDAGKAHNLQLQAKVRGAQSKPFDGHLLRTDAFFRDQHDSTQHERRNNTAMGSVPSSSVAEHMSSQEKMPSSQPTIRPGGNSQKSTLNFPVVKDPNDPITILRFSQETSNAKALPEIVGRRASYPQKSESTSQLSSSTIKDIASADIIASEVAALVYDAFNIPPGTHLGCLRRSCPSPNEVSSTLSDHGYSTIVYQKPHYSDDGDVPERPRDYAGKEFRLEGTSIRYLPEFDPSGRSLALRDGISAPRDRSDWQNLDNQLRAASTSRFWEFAPVPPSRAEVITWFESQKREILTQKAKSKKQREERSKALSQIEGPTQNNELGSKYSQNQKSTSVEHQAQYMSTMSLEVHVNTRGALSPNPEEDEIASFFWCFSSEDDDSEDDLSSCHVGVVFQGERVRPELKISKALSLDWEHEPTELDLINRLVDIVRLYDPDIITGYEVHNGSWGYVIERARKKYEFDLCNELSRVKSQWGFNHTSSIRVTGRHMVNIWRAMRSEMNLLQYTMENVVFQLLHRRIPHYSDKPRDFMKVVNYFVSRLIPRTSEQARLLGIDFYSVFSRGSQFKVESLMFRIAKPENFVLQNALDDFYTSPLLVLDFQSLYPSIMIAYNYCYSTFLGRVQSWRGRNKMGFMDYNQINIAPNGMIYAKPEVRLSLLAKMLAEILETRVMVKTGMKLDKDDKALQRLLNNRQLALKLIANVTYGYTSASFSGRMPCSEIADSIVQSGRETLERAIAFIHSVERWGAEVVYGDTDSLFVYLKGRTREEAFNIGEEIARALKFEKVYHPCILLAKKRYVGFKYEHRDQKEPDFDAKGIETIRRDGTPAGQKIEEKALKILFRTADLSQVKRRVSIQDFCFARAVRLGTYSEKGTLPAGALISTKKMLEDPRAEPQYGERVPYVVTLLQNAQLELDAEYYITKNLIPPLERLFNLMPKFHRIRRSNPLRTLELYMKSSACIVCKVKLEDAEVPLCTDCMQNSHISLLDLVSRLRHAEQKVANLEHDVKCDSLDCPVFYARTRNLAHWRHTNADNCGDSLDW